MEQRALTRREFLVLSGSGLAAAGVLGPQPVLAQSTTIRQGYQTNIWGMPTYYLLRSGALEKRGLKFEEFAVPSGNLTMQQMVARQVDLGTYAGQSFVTGHDKGGLGRSRRSKRWERPRASWRGRSSTSQKWPTSRG